ncbi:MAG: hypothetical protein AAF928_09115 [Myxococcota bacterium]
MRSVRRYLAVGALVAFGALELVHAAAMCAMDVRVLLQVLGVAHLAIAVGVARRRYWGRLLGLGAGLGALFVFAALASVGAVWLPLGYVAAGLTAALLGRGMADHMNAGTRDERDVWREEGGWFRPVLTAGVVVSVAAVPTLLILDLMTARQGVHGVLLPSGLGAALAVTFVGCSLLLTLRKTAGLLLMFPASVVASVIAGRTLLMLYHHDFLFTGTMGAYGTRAALTTALGGVVSVVALVTAAVCIAFSLPMYRYLARRTHPANAG